MRLLLLGECLVCKCDAAEGGCIVDWIKKSKMQEIMQMQATHVCHLHYFFQNFPESTSTYALQVL